MSRFSDYITKLIVGVPWGEVYPGRPAPPPTSVDGRTAALRVLRTFLSELTFFRENKGGEESIPFQIPVDRIHIEWPDSVDEAQLPIIALISGGPIDYQFVGLGSWNEEESRDVFGKNTMLQVNGENVEPIWIEVLCKTKQERRALREGIRHALMPTEFMAGIRFRVPEFYNQVVCFQVQRGVIVEAEDSVKNRRGLRIEIEMSYLDVVLVNVEPLIPMIATFVDTEDEGLTALSLDVQDPDRVAIEADEGAPMPPFVDLP